VREILHTLPKDAQQAIIQSLEGSGGPIHNYDTAGGRHRDAATAAATQRG
jgi:hypothetical protein